MFCLLFTPPVLFVISKFIFCLLPRWKTAPQAAKKPASSIDEELAKMLASPTLDFSAVGGDDDGDSGAGVGDDFDFNSYIKQAASASSSTSNNLFD